MFEVPDPASLAGLDRGQLKGLDRLISEYLNTEHGEDPLVAESIRQTHAEVRRRLVWTDPT